MTGVPNSGLVAGCEHVEAELLNRERSVRRSRVGECAEVSVRSSGQSVLVGVGQRAAFRSPFQSAEPPNDARNEFQANHTR